MAKGCSNKYEEARKQRLEENKKRFEDLGISTIAKNLTEVASPVKKSPSRLLKPRSKSNAVVEPRRSSRARNPVPSYREEVTADLPHMRKRSRSSSASWGSYIARPLEELRAATEGERSRALEAAEAIQNNLQSSNPSFVKSMVRSHVYSCFWLGLPSWFCEEHLPKTLFNMVLEDENGSEYNAVYIGSRSGLSGGWRAFALEHKLDDGDALVFQLVEANRFKIYIVKAAPDSVEEDGSDTQMEEENTPTAKVTKALKAVSNRESQTNKIKKPKQAIQCETKESESSQEQLPERSFDEVKQKEVNPTQKTRSSQKKMQKKSELPASPESKGESQFESLKPKAVIKKTKSSQTKLLKKSELTTIPESKGEPQAETVKPEADTKMSNKTRKSKEGILCEVGDSGNTEQLLFEDNVEATEANLGEKKELVQDAYSEFKKVEPGEEACRSASQKPRKKTRKSKEGIVCEIGDSRNTEQLLFEDNAEVTEANQGEKKEIVQDADSEFKKVEPRKEASRSASQKPRKKSAPRFFRKRA